MQWFIIQESSPSNTAGVSVEVQRLQSPAGIQHLAPFSSEPSVFVLRCSQCLGRRLLNAKAQLRKSGVVFFKLLRSLFSLRRLLPRRGCALTTHYLLGDYSRAVPLISPLQTTVIHLLFTLRAPPPPTVTSVCQVRACGDKDYQEDQRAGGLLTTVE